MSLLPWWVGTGLVAQALVLVAIASPGPPAGAALVGGACVSGAVAAAGWRRLDAHGRAVLAMLALGGLGMTLGWWADLGFGSAAALLAVEPSPALAGAWCGLSPEAARGVGHLHLLSWMNAGMLGLGVLAVRVPGSLRARCSGFALAVECLAMLLGMNAGAWLAGHAASGLAPSVAVVTAHALMNGGMLAGMLAVAPWLRERGAPVQLVPVAP